MDAHTFRPVGLTIAVTNMEAMKQFYSELFGFHFEVDQGLSDRLGTSLYRVALGNFSLLFCPNTIAGVEAQQNRQQWDLEVANFDDYFGERLTALGGSIKTPPFKSGEFRSGAIIDPDGNTLVLKEVAKP